MPIAGSKGSLSTEQIDVPLEQPRHLLHIYIEPFQGCVEVAHEPLQACGVARLLEQADHRPHAQYVEDRQDPRQPEKT